jgi:hypothetical protein
LQVILRKEQQHAAASQTEGTSPRSLSISSIFESLCDIARAIDVSAVLGHFAFAASATGDHVSAVGNVLSGRIGEALAVNFLTSKKQELGIEHIEWCNEGAESFLPFDIRIKMSDGQQRYCEVKTHSHTSASPNYFVSPSELSLAFSEGSKMFCMCVWIAPIEPSSTSVVLRDAFMIGWQHGLLQSIEQREASLILRVNNMNVGAP